MSYTLYQVDAFTDRLFGGNPAAIVPLQEWLPDETMQLLGRENNLAETAFFIPTGQADCYRLRWFTPTKEVRLCGHATLAAAFVIFNCLKSNHSDKVSFDTLSGWLHVTRDGDVLTLDFPADPPAPASLDAAALSGFNVQPQAVYRGTDDYLLVYGSESEVRALEPDFAKLKRVSGTRGFIATAPGDAVDFVSRCFFPAYGIDEDPVTGSAHTAATPYWAGVLGKNDLRAVQCSEREGHLRCVLQGDRVLLSGTGVLYMEGRFNVK